MEWRDTAPWHRGPPSERALAPVRDGEPIEGARDMWLGIEPGQPLTHQVEALAIDAIDSGAALTCVAEQARVFEHAQMPRGGWPGVFEARSELPCRGRATTKV
jgi:hypothetical protein